MKTKYTLFQRGEMFCMQDSATGKQTNHYATRGWRVKWFAKPFIPVAEWPLN